MTATRRLIPAILMLASLLTVNASADQPMPRTVVTMGDAVIYVTPDEVTVNFGVQTFAAQLDKAKNANDANSADLIKSIKGLGIEEKLIHTDNLRIQVEYEGPRPSDGITGYVARRTYAITLKDIKLFEKLVDTGLKHGANQMIGFQFRVSDLRKYRDQARITAVKAAREKAIALTKELGVSIGKPRQIIENNVYDWWSDFSNNSSQNSGSAPQRAADDGEELPLGQIPVRAEVSVTFDLAD